MTALSPNFQLHEFTDNKHGISNVPDDNQIKNLILWCMNIGEPLRKHYKLPIVITSGFRSKALNEAVGGAANSQHTKGEAADFHVPGIVNADIWGYITGELDFDQVIAEYLELDDGDAGWIHASFSAKHNRKDARSCTRPGQYPRGLVFI